MTKAELITKMAEDAGVTKSIASKILDSFIENVVCELENDGKITLVGFGTFSIVKREARVGRNPQTGEKIQIKAKKTIKFKAGKGLAEKLG